MELLSQTHIHNNISHYIKLKPDYIPTLVDYLGVLDLYQQIKLQGNGTMFIEPRNLVTMLIEKKATVNAELTESMHEYKLEHSLETVQDKAPNTGFLIIPLCSTIIILSVITGIKYLSGF